MSFSRRQFIKSTGLLLGATSLPSTSFASNISNALPIPPLLEVNNGRPVFLTMQNAHWSFSGGRKSSVWGFNGLYLGPTVRVKNGTDTKIIYNNRLNEAISLSVSGLLVPGILSGGSSRVLPPGSDWSPIIPIRQAASTCWYHAATPRSMANHIYNGLAGMWLIEDDISPTLPLPRQYGVDDFPIIIQDKQLGSFGNMEYNPSKLQGFMGDTLVVNGVQNPFIEVAKGWVRLRLLNASNSRRFTLSLSTGQNMFLVGNDQGLVSTPASLSQLNLAPGERREILLDTSNGQEVTITAGKPASFIDRIKGLFEPSTTLLSTSVLTLKPTGLSSLVTDTLPNYLVPRQAIPESVTNTRTLTLDNPTTGINGNSWDPNRIDIQAQSGTWERWIVRANLPQSFHIQGVSFLIRSVNGAQPLAEDNGWKDTVWVDGEVELLVYFSQLSNREHPFLYYSQTLEFADQGTMGQFIVT